METIVVDCQRPCEAKPSVGHRPSQLLLYLIKLWSLLRFLYDVLEQ